MLCFLKGDPARGLLLSAFGDLQLYAYYDSDWARCPLSHRSIIGYFFMLSTSSVSWKTKKQNIVSCSSTEAEYRAMATTTIELLWLKAFLTSLGVSHLQPMWLFCDNQAALHIAANPVFYERTKHIEIDCHFVREHLLAKTISTTHVRSEF